MARKERRYGDYYRKRVKNPITEKYQDVYGRTKAERDAKADALKAEWARQLSLAASPYFYTYAADWFARVAPDMSAARRVTVAREINSNICPVIGAKRLAELTSDDCLDVMAARTARSVSARRTTLQTLNRILNAAADAGKIPRNPAAGVTAGGDPRKKKTALTPAQQKTLLEAVRGLRIALFVQMGLYTGLRREELCGLLWRDVELDSPAPHINVRRACRWPKNTQPVVADYLKSEAGWRTIPLPDVLVAALRDELARLGDLPPEQLRSRCVIGYADGRPWSLKTLTEAWASIEARSAGTVIRRRKDPATGKTAKVAVEKKLGDAIPKHPGVVVSIDFPVTAHSLRRTYITRLILGGVDLKRVQYLAGHEDPEITLRIYTDLMGHRPEDLIDDVRGIFDGPG